MSALDSVYAGVRPAWYRRGWVNEQGWDYATEAGEQSGMLGVEYVTRPLFTNFAIPDPVTGKKHMTKIETDEFLAILRGPIPATQARTEAVDNWEIISVVSPKYEFIHPAKVLSILDQVSDRTVNPDAWPVESIGLLQQGRRMFVALRMGIVDLFNDNPKERAVVYLNIGQDFRPGRALEVTVSVVNIVCANTWDAALSNNQVRITIPHFKGAADKTDLAVKVIKAAHEKQAGAVEMLRKLQSVKVTEEQVVEIVNLVYPMPKKDEPDQPLAITGTIFDPVTVAEPKTVKGTTLAKNTKRASAEVSRYEAAVARVAARRAYMLETWERYLDERTTGQTLYTALGAMVEATERRTGRGDAALSLLNPQGGRRLEKRAAFKAALSVTGAKL